VQRKDASRYEQDHLLIQLRVNVETIQQSSAVKIHLLVNLYMNNNVNILVANTGISPGPRAL